MTLADIVGVMSGPDRVRIMKGKAELYAGYLGSVYTHISPAGYMGIFRQIC